MKTIESVESFDEFISGSEIAIVLFATRDCATCKPVELKLEKHFSDYKLTKVYLDDLKILAGRLSIFNVPVVSIFFQSKELYRFIRVFSMDEIAEKLKRLKEFM